jgi:amino acid permease
LFLKKNKVRRGSRDLDFSSMTRRTLGGSWATMSGFINILVMIGASVAYHILMKDCLHVIGSAVIGWTEGIPAPAPGPVDPNSSSTLISSSSSSSSSISYHTTTYGENLFSNSAMIPQHISPTMAFWNKHGEYAALIVLVIFPLTTLKNLQVLVKFNSAGVFFLGFNIFFMVYQGVNTATADNNQGWKTMVQGNYTSMKDVPFWGSNMWFKPLTFGALA